MMLCSNLDSMITNSLLRYFTVKRDRIEVIISYWFISGAIKITASVSSCSRLSLSL